MKDLVQIALESRGNIKIERCISQVFRPSEEYATPRENKGYCYECIFNPKQNRSCSGYKPIKVTYQLREER